MKVKCSKCTHEEELKLLGTLYKTCVWKCKKCGYENTDSIKEKEVDDKT